MADAISFAGGGHVLEILTTGNLAPGNAGVVLYTDILIPLIGFVLLWLAHRHRREGLARSNALNAA